LACERFDLVGYTLGSASVPLHQLPCRPTYRLAPIGVGQQLEPNIA
jgi:hypothetical protein